jgi:hypothetical protein
MGRERREFNRTSGLRDSTLFVIAAESAKTEPKYFWGVQGKLHNSKIHIEVLERRDATHSSPSHVLSMLDSFSREYKIREGDQLWLVMDRDPKSWREAAIAQIARECHRKGYHLALSNPCFELWLLLHFEDVPSQDSTRKKYLFANRDQCLKAEIGKLVDGNISYIDNFYPQTELAIERAKSLDDRPASRWPSTLGTRVYRLLEILCAIQPT